MFKNVFGRYDGTDATIEILLMLLVAFLLGMLFRALFGRKSSGVDHSEELELLRNQNAGLERDLGLCRDKLSECNKSMSDQRAEINKLSMKAVSVNTPTVSKSSAIVKKAAPKKAAPKKTVTKKATTKKAAPKKAAPKKVAAITTHSYKGKKVKSDDLKIVEGVGPVIEKLMKSAGIKNWDMLSKTSVVNLRKILKAGGDRFRMHDPASWPHQAKLAAKGQFDKLETYQDFLGKK